MNKKQMEFFIKNIYYQDIYEVISFACNYKNSLTNDDKEKIVKRLSTVGNKYVIEDILNDIEWLTKENIDFIINNLINHEAWNYEIYSYLIEHCPKLSNNNIKSLIFSYVRFSDFSSEKLNHFYKSTRNLSKENICFLVDEISNIKDAGIICGFYDLATDLSKENKIKLIKAIIKTGTTFHMYQVAQKVSYYNDKDYINLLVEGISSSNNTFNNTFNIYNFLKLDLSLENTDKLINKLVSLKSGEYIYKTAMNCKNLSPKNIESLVNGIIHSNDSFYIYKFLTRVKNLNTNYYKALTDELFELKDFDVIKMMIDDYLNGSYHKKIGVDFEKRILNTKDLLIITYYLIKTNNKNLIKLFFETTEKFLVFVLINKELLDKDETLICKLTENISFKDANLNMEKYVKIKN